MITNRIKLWAVFLLVNAASQLLAQPYANSLEPQFNKATSSSYILNSVDEYSLYLQTESTLQEKFNADFYQNAKQTIGVSKPSKITYDTTLYPLGSCNNLDFETGNFNGWTPLSGCNPANAAQINCTPKNQCCPTTGIKPSRHTITTLAMGNDPVCGFPRVAPGGNYSAMLGQPGGGGQADRLQQTFLVTKQNSAFIYQYAVVLQDPGHANGKNPKFEAAFFDQTGDTIPCSYYLIEANKYIPGGFYEVPYDSANQYTMYGRVLYKPWTYVIVDLSAYIGQNVTARFTAMDCGEGLHYGYAYIDCACGPWEIQASDSVFCEGDNINVTLTAPSGAYSYSWNTGDTTQTITVNTTGTYSVEVGMVVDSTCRPVLTFDLNGFPKPDPGFTATTVCLGNPTVLTDTSVIDTGYIATRTWDFGDGSPTSSQQNPTHTYAAAGTYTVTLTLVSDKGCSDTISKTVTVAPPVNPSFIADTVCMGNVTTFTNNSTGNISSYSWSFGGGDSSNLQTPSYEFANAGTHNVTLTVTSAAGCSQSVTVPVIVNPLPVADFSPTSVCLNTPTNFTDNTSGTVTSWQWNLGDGATSTQQNPVHTYTASGTYQVTLIVSGACSDTVQKPVVVYEKPLANFSSQTVCEGKPTSFSDISNVNSGDSVITWSWNFGDGQSATQNNPSHTYNADGTFTTTLIVTTNSGCKDTVQNIVTVDPAPVAEFTSNTVCLGNPTTYSDASQGSPSSWSWNFGEPASGINNTSTLQNPSHTYLSAGTYSVELIVDAGGCVDTVTHVVVIAPSANADYTPTAVCLNNQTQFADASSTSQGNVSNWSWNFGEPSSGVNNTSTQQNPTHTYGAAGTYTVNLTITTDQGCIDTVNKVVLVNPLPDISFTAPTVCVGSSTIFTDFSTVAPPSVVTGWSWNFGDATISNAQNPQHTYATPGTYTVLLTVTTDKGCQQNISQSVSVSPIPVPAFTPTTVCLNTPTQFTDNSTGILTSWDWNFGDGTSHATIQNPVHTYTASGTYNVTLIIAAGSCKDTLTSPVTVYALPQTVFSADSVCQGMATNFADASLGSPSSWSWNFGEPASVNNTSTQQSPIHIYNADGVYSVSLIVTTVNGCKDTLTKNIIVYPLPTAAFSGNTVCQNSATNFVDASLGSPSSWSWNFGEPASATNTSVLQNPSHVFAAAGSYTTTLIVQTAYGCKDTVTNPVNVIPSPQVSFTVNDTAGCVPLCVSFKDLTSAATGDPLAVWSWNFGDGGGSIEQHPSYCYKTPGDYDVSLSVTSANGCTANFTEQDYIHVYPYPVADFTPSPEVASYLDPHFTFTDASSGASSWMWNFGDNGLWTSSTGSTEYTYDVGNTGIITFDVTLAITNEYGCADTIVKPVKIEPEWTFYVPNTFTPNGDGFNEGFVGKGIGIKEYEMWIYDRWGNEIYHCTDINDPWDGKVQNGASGEVAQIDTYVWVIKIQDVFEKRHRYIGHVNIVK